MEEMGKSKKAFVKAVFREMERSPRSQHAGERQSFTTGLSWHPLSNVVSQYFS
jgi:hypothetical protein